jgi:hypothetical protein
LFKGCDQLVGKGWKMASQTLNSDFAASFGAAELAAARVFNMPEGWVRVRCRPLCAHALHNPLEGCGASAQ